MASQPIEVSDEWQALFFHGKPRQSPVNHRCSLSGRSFQVEVSIKAGRQQWQIVSETSAWAINAYRVRTIEADIDPLGRKSIQDHPELTLGYYGLTEADLDVPVSGHGVYGFLDHHGA